MKKVEIVFQRHVLEIRKNKHTWDKGQRTKKKIVNLYLRLRRHSTNSSANKPRVIEN